MNLNSSKNWKQVKLGDIAEVRRGASPRPIQDFLSLTGMPWVKISDATADETRYINSTKQFIKEEGIRNTVIVNEGDFIVSNSATPGLPKFMKITAGVHDGWLIIKPDENLIDKLFLYYQMIYDRPRLVGQASGAVFDNLKTDTLREHDFLLPSLKEQKEIAAILGSLDDKIELLRRENKTIESIAQTLFKEWFVDFKFPGYEKAKIVGGIPEGWKVGKLTDIAEFLNGVASQKYPAENKSESLPVIKIREMKSGITTDTDRATSKIDLAYIVKSGDMLFSWSGSLDIVLWNDIDGVLNQHLFKVTSENYPKWFYYYWVLQHLPEFKSIAESKATTMGHIQRHHLDDAEVIIPNEKTFMVINDAMTPLLDKQILNNSEIKKLAQTRDSLLNEIFSH